jgi:nucleoside 2-deoxyribosyltransferase
MSKWIYLAGPLFTAAELNFNQHIASQLRHNGYQIYLPQQQCAGVTDPVRLFDICVKGLQGASLVLVLLDGPDADSGSCFEVGYAYAKGLPIVGVRTDFRGSGEYMGINLMLASSCTRLLVTRNPAHAHTPPPSGVTYMNMGDDVIPYILDVLSALAAAQAARIG